MLLDVGRSSFFDQPRLDRILKVLRGHRLPLVGLDEAPIRDGLADALRGAGVPCLREFGFAPRMRADIWIEPGILIEVKKCRPRMDALLEQLGRYAATGRVEAIVLVLERSVVLPEAVMGVPVAVVSLNGNWGLAV